MKRKTTITLTIVGLLAMAGILYAATSTQFGSATGVIGVASAPGDLLVTEYSTQNLDTIDCNGKTALLARIPGPAGVNLERYLVIAPTQSAIAGFTPRDIFVTQGNDIYRVRPPASPTLFTSILGCGDDHTGITFDHVGTFGYNMIVTCQNGGVWNVGSTGTPTHIADVLGGSELEGPAVAPSPGFGPLSGQILAADEDNGKVHAIDNTGQVTYNVFSWYGAEGVVVIPPNPCSFCSGGSSFFQAIENLDAIYQYPLTDFAGLTGSILVTSEFGQGTAVITWDGSNYNSSTFDNIPGATIEGSSFADCDVPVPTATPTSTATATATATPVATATPTATATATAVACWNYDKYAVFGLNSVDLSSAGNLSSVPGIVGDCAVGGGAYTGNNQTSTILQKTTVNGRVFIDSSATPDIRSFFTATGGIFFGQDLSQDEADVLALSAQIAALPPTQTFANITAAKTITSTTALNVINVNSINLTKANLTLVGSSTDTFLINVTSPTALFVMNGVKVILSGGLTPNHVVFNIPGTGGTVQVYKQTSGLNGTLLAPQRDVTIDNVTVSPWVTGSVIGSSVYVHSAARVIGIHCP